MKLSLLFIFNFLLLNAYAQESKINAKDIIGCWKFVQYVDTAKKQPISTIKGSDFLIEFKSNNQYAGMKRKGDWVLDNERRTITLYQSEFSADDREMAEYFKQTPREATKMELGGLKIENDYLYYLTASEIPPYQIYSKMKRENCR